MLMNILFSDWLKRMVEKAGSTPQARIDALFKILQDWTDAPGMRQRLQEAPLSEADHRALKAYLLQLVLACGVSNPESVSGQLYLILLGALSEEMRNPHSHALSHAGQAANLLVARQAASRTGARSAMVAVASVLVVASALVLYVPTLERRSQIETESPGFSRIALATVATNPDRVAALYQMHDKIQTGQCGYPQALMLPPEQRALFLENVVSLDKGKIAPESFMLVSQLYQKVDCYYPPAAMLL